MSRIERHRQHREGDVSSSNKSDFVELEDDFEINPIASKENAEAKRKKTYVSNKSPVNKVVEKNQEIAKVQQKMSSQNEIFDIEVAFQKIEKKRKESHVDSDTQAQIITEIFSNDMQNYQDIDYKKDEDTNKILISEEELLKLLDEREQNYKKELERKKRKERLVNKQKEISPKANDVINEEVKLNKVKKTKIVNNHNEDHKLVNEHDFINKKQNKKIVNEFEPKEFYNKKSTALLKVILIILVAVLAYFVFSFFR